MKKISANPKAAANLKDMALTLATLAHEGQSDKAGVPYINHLTTVAAAFEDDVTVAIALLHDIVEDTDFTLHDLLSMGFPYEVVQAVDCLTKRDNEKYSDYLHRISSNGYAIKVKIADLKHNSDLSRLTEVMEKDMRRVEKYALALDWLIKL